MGNIINLQEEAQITNQKKYAKWVIETLTHMIEIEQDIIAEMEDTLEGFKHLDEIRAEEFKADKTKAIAEYMIAVNDIAETMAKYNWLKDANNNNEGIDND